MLHEIKTLTGFIDYCEKMIEANEEEDNTEWFLFVMSQNITEDNLIEDIETTLDIMYKWLGIAQREEMYLNCGIIFNAIDIENEHYAALGKQVLKKSIKKQLKSINEELKTKYLYV